MTTIVPARRARARTCRTRTGAVAVGIVAAFVATAGACAPGDSWRFGERAPYAETDSMGGQVEVVRIVASHARIALEEASAAVMSVAQPGVLFTINDSGNDETLFALDTAGNDRGVWHVKRARNIDWETMSPGACGTTAPGELADSAEAIAAGRACLYIGDTGDNGERRGSRTIYRIAEPRVAVNGGENGSLRAERLDYRYADRPHDVEAMYVAPDGAVVLITKRPLDDGAGRRRPALVFTLPAAAWARGDTATAALVDSLPIVPGSAPMRVITDAALSDDRRWLAVRTYAQVYVFATDTTTGLVRHDVPMATCHIAALAEEGGEGISWIPGSTLLVLTSEGVRAPLQIVRCPLPGTPSITP